MTLEITGEIKRGNTVTVSFAHGYNFAMGYASAWLQVRKPSGKYEIHGHIGVRPVSQQTGSFSIEGDATLTLDEAGVYSVEIIQITQNVISSAASSLGISAFNATEQGVRDAAKNGSLDAILLWCDENQPRVKAERLSFKVEVGDVTTSITKYQSAIHTVLSVTVGGSNDYQCTWQESTDGVTWTDIAGETRGTFIYKTWVGENADDEETAVTKTESIVPDKIGVFVRCKVTTTTGTAVSEPIYI